MKHLLMIFFALASYSGFAQDSTSVDSEKAIEMSAVESRPEFPGGMKAFYEFIAANYKRPNVAGLSGKIDATFVVDKDGKIIDIKIMRDLGYGTGKEAIRVLKKSPRWIPGQQNGKTVRVQYAIPISL